MIRRNLLIALFVIGWLVAACATGASVVAEKPEVGVWVDPGGRGTCFVWVSNGGTPFFSCVR